VYYIIILHSKNANMYELGAVPDENSLLAPFWVLFIFGFAVWCILAHVRYNTVSSSTVVFHPRDQLIHFVEHGQERSA